MATEVYKYRLFCETEQVYVEGWGEQQPTVCYNDQNHTISLSSITEIDVVSDNNVVISGVDINGSDHLVEQQKGFIDRSGYNVFRKGYSFIANNGEETNYDATYDNTMLLEGIGFRCDENATFGDYVEVEIVDVDGIYYPAGSVLAKFGETIYVWANREYSVLCGDVKTLPAGVYMRFRYVSIGSADVHFVLEHYLRTTP